MRTKQRGFMRAAIYPRLVRPLQLNYAGQSGRGFALIFATHHPRLTLWACPNTLCVMQTVQPPINLDNWIEENGEKFKPAGSDGYLYEGRDFLVIGSEGWTAKS